jgi:hypothetical protein
VAGDTLGAVKILRIWLLLILAVLVPVRGAVAAVMPCAEEGAHPHAVHGAVHVHALAMADADEHMHDAAVPMHHHGHDGADKCNLCASCCSATPMLTTFAPTIAQLDEPAATFPVFQASAPIFVSEGQERPPRSI